MTHVILMLGGVAIVAILVRILDSHRVVGLVLLGLLALPVLGRIASRSSSADRWEHRAVAGDRCKAHRAHSSGSPVSAAASGAGEDRAPAEASMDEPLIQLDPGPKQAVEPPRPDWVESEPVLSGAVHTLAVSSGPEETERDCRRALDRELEKAVDAYIDRYVGPVYGGRFKASRFIHYDADEIRRRLVKEQFHEVVQVSFGPMQQMHALVALDEAFRNELDRRRGELVAMGRVRATGLGLGIVLAVLAVAFGYLRLNLATGGRRARWLRLSAAAAILGLIAAGAFAAGHVLW